MTDTIGPQVDDPWRGWLVFESLPADLQRAEDSTQHADAERLRGCYPVTWRYDSDAETWYFEREATDAEQTLLTHLGYTLPVEGDDGYPLQTRVSYKTETLRHRSWPALETTEGEQP